MKDSNANDEADVATRRKIASFLVMGGTIVVGCIGISVVMTAHDDNARERATQLVLTSILPLVGTWIGTVLAFYFAKENFEAASRATKELLGIDEKLRSIPVTKVMIPVANVDAFKLGTAATISAAGAGERVVKVPANAGDILIDDAIDFLVAKKRNRLPVLDANGACVYVIHISTLDKFRSRQLRLTPGSIAETEKWNLNDLRLKDPESFKAILAWATVPEGATLADAKFAMETTPSCIDVMITKTGKSDGAVIGWLTNIEIAEHSKA